MRALHGVGLVMILAGLGAYYATDQLSPFSIANLIVGPVLLAAAAIANSRKISGFSGALSKRIVWRWSGIGVSVLAVVVGINYLGRDWGARIDLTVAQNYSLSDQSHQICAELEEAGPTTNLDLYFFEDSLVARDVRLLVKAYEADCSHLSVHDVRYEDAPRHAAEVFGSYNTTVVACAQARCDPIGYPSEENITNSIARLSRGQSRPLRGYFVIGHGEIDLASQAGNGFSGVAELLRNEGVEARASIGPSQKDVPDDADVLIIAAPERGFLEPEIASIERYLENGGRLLVLLEPGTQTNLIELLERWGFGIGDGIVADRATSPLLRDSKAISLITHRFSADHPVTRKMSNRTMVLNPGARPIRRQRKPQPKDRLENLAYSSRHAWVERDVEGALAGRPIRADAEELQDLEIPIAAAGSYPRGDREARIVVIGDRDFASNRLLSSLYGKDLFMNSFWWLAENDSRIAIRPKFWTPDQDPLTLQQTVAYFYFMAFALPELLLLLGIRAWYRQRS
ncbi:MAG: GldG family protein [bacterium]|nr:GldG family protein [bacterium]